MKKPYIKCILHQADVMLIQEHWLLHNKLHLLQNISDDYLLYAKSGIDDSNLLLGQPYGGCAIYIKKNIKCTVTDIDTDSNRLCAILADFASYKILIICAYMPCESTHISDFNYVLGII